MKRLAYTIIALLSFCVVSQGQTVTTKSDPTKGVREAFDRLMDGIRQVDAEKVMSVYDNSEQTLFFNNNGTATLGWKTMKEVREKSYSRTKNVSLEITGLRIEMLGAAAAYITCKWKQSQEFDGSPENASGRMTLVFRKLGKEWKVVHLHTSPDSPAASRPVMPSERATPAQ